MPPKKKQEAGIARLIGKTISLANTHDESKVVCKLVGHDDTFIEIEIDGRVFFFNKNDISGITEVICG